MTPGFSQTTLAFASALLCTAPAAFALNADDFVEKLGNGMHAGRTAMQAGIVRLEGDDIILQDVSYRVNAAGGQSTVLPLGNMTFIDVRQTPTGGYTAASANIDGFAVGTDTVVVRMSDVDITNLYIPADIFAENELPFIQYDRATSGPASIEQSGKLVAKMDGLTSHMDRSALPLLTGRSDLDGLEMSLPAPAGSNMQAQMKALQLDRPKGDVSLAFNWNTATGNARLDNYEFDLPNVGKLAMDVDLSGYTLDVAKSQIRASRDIPRSADPQTALTQMQPQMLTMMQKMSLDSAEISFVDAGVTHRALNYYGKKQGASGAQLAAMLPMLAGIGLAGLELPHALLGQVTGSLNTYLGNPQSFEITARPSTPVSIADIAAMGMAAPKRLPDLLNLSVRVNQ